MYDIIAQIIDHSWVSGSSEQQYVFYTCAALILILSVVFIDIIKSVIGQYLPK